MPIVTVGDAVVMSLLGHEDLGGYGACCYYVEAGCYSYIECSIDVAGSRNPIAAQCVDGGSAALWDCDGDYSWCGCDGNIVLDRLNA